MKKLMIILAAMLILCLLVPVACARAPEESAVAPAVEEMTMPSRGETVYKEGGGLPAVDEERMIVRSGDMSLVVEDVVEARDNIAQLAVGFGGYVVSSRISGEEQDMRGNISIRVPDDSLEQTLSELRDLAVRVTSESTESRDVTEEYVDLESRLNNAEATESQYLALLKEAEDVEDILRIYERLSQVRGEIEQIKGRMQYLERISSMSIVSVYLKPVASSKPLVGAGWSPIEAFKSAIRGIVAFGQWLVTVAIWLAIFSPLWGAIIGIIFWRRRRRKKAA
jgi:hypothetical protein